MAKDDAGGDRATTPTHFPDTTPPSYPGTDFSFTLQAVYDLKGTVSRLEQAIANLQASIADQRIDIKSLQRTIHIATGFFLALSVLGSALLAIYGRQLWDTLADISELIRHAPRP